VLYEKEYPNIFFAIDGEVYDLDDFKCIVIGGAYSVDKFYRLERGFGWWPDEQMTAVQRQAAMTLYEQTRPRYVVSHDAPTAAAKALLEPLCVSGPYSNSGYYEAKYEGIQQSFISQMMQVMLEIHAPEHWVFAHFHTSKTFKLEKYPTQFQVLGINEVADAPFENFTDDETTSVDPNGELHSMFEFLRPAQPEITQEATL
jgi:hypothetical protein